MDGDESDLHFLHASKYKEFKILWYSTVVNKERAEVNLYCTVAVCMIIMTTFSSKMNNLFYFVLKMFESRNACIK